MSEKKPFTERLAGWTRVALLAAIAVVLGLILTTPRDEVSGYPRFMTRAQAEGIAANPGYLLTSVGVGNADKFYLVDTNKQVICVYGVTNDQFNYNGGVAQSLPRGGGTFQVTLNNFRQTSNSNNTPRPTRSVFRIFIMENWWV